METIEKKGNNKKIAIITGIIVALIIAIVAGTFMVQATPANKVKKQLQLAEKYLEDLDYDKALAAYNEAIQIDPRCEEAYLAMADIYIKTGDEEKAMEIIEKGQENIQTDAMTKKLQEVKKYVASAGQSGQGGEVVQEKTTQAPTQPATEAPTQKTTEEVTEAPTETPTEAPTEEVTEAPTEVPTEAPTEAPTQPQAVVRAGNVGEIITLGRYEQDGDESNGSEPIEWLVLEKQGDKMLVISKYGLDAKPYNTDWTKVTWETCTLRGWLNSEFLNMAFNDSEREMIRITLLENPDNPKRKKPVGNATNDKVFLLSLDEAERYFATMTEGKTEATQYAKNNGVITRSNGCCHWWLRSPGDYYGTYAASVNDDGAVNYSGIRVSGVRTAVRPALWINL